MDREEYIRRATELFDRYIEAFRDYDDSESDDDLTGLLEIPIFPDSEEDR